MRVMVDETRCQGHGLCVMNAPGVFDLDEETGRATVLPVHLGAEFVAEAEWAAGNCPEQAISIALEEETA
jgi:ferredoxin